MGKSKRKVPGINASSTADISFILLIFFLVVTSMDSQLGLKVTLPEKQDDEKDPPKLMMRNVLSIKVNKENKVLISSAGKLRLDSEEDVDKIGYARLMEKYDVPADSLNFPIDRLCELVKDFARNSDDAAFFPQLYDNVQEYYDEKKEVHVLPSVKAGQEPVKYAKNHVVSLTTDRATSYSTYFKVVHELYKAYDELRDELSQKEYGKLFNDLEPTEQALIKLYYPNKIFEAEPIGYK